MSNYFLNIPNVWYALDINQKPTLLQMKDIACNVRVNDYILNTLSQYNTYAVINGDTWDSISQKLYGVPHYHWLLMILNLKWGGNSDLPVTEDILVDQYNASMARQTDTGPIDRWDYEDPRYRMGLLQYQVAANFTDGEESFALNEDTYGVPLTTTTLSSDPDHGEAIWAQQPSLNYVIDSNGLISLPLDVYDSDLFMSKRPWLSSDPANPLDMNSAAQLAYNTYVNSFQMLTARDAIVNANNELAVIKVLDKNAIPIAANQILSILKDAA